MGKVLGIFLHQLTSRPRRVFLYVQPIHSSSTVRDEIPDLPILKLDMMNDDVIGLSAVEIVTHPPKFGDDEGGHTRQNRRNFTVQISKSIYKARPFRWENLEKYCFACWPSTVQQQSGGSDGHISPEL
jgi:hypothetical protein